MKMKKTYLNPSLKEIEIDVTSSILETSIPKSSSITVTDPAKILSNRKGAIGQKSPWED